MSAKLKITTRVRRLTDYIADIEGGLLQVPGFQRDFVWTIGNMLELFESLKMGYPIGTLLLWRPDRSYGENDKIGPYFIPKNPDNFYYILDGFQRINTLFGCLINPSKTSLGIDRSLLKNFRIYYDLSTEEFAQQRSNSLEIYQIPVYKLIDNKETFLWQRQLIGMDDNDVELYLERYESIGNTLLSFYLPSIDINGGRVDEAIDIFWRLNSKGSIISPDWIVSARTYDMDENFRLGTQIDNLLAELKPYNFGSIKREVILQCIQSSFGKIYFEMNIDEVVKRVDFREKAYRTIDSIKKAVKFLYEELLVVDSKLLPASVQLIFITEFFNHISNPTQSEIQTLKRWFWQTSYSNYFTILSPSRRKDAFAHFLTWLAVTEGDPFYNDKPGSPFVVSDFPTKIHFGSVRSKSLILFLLGHSNDFQSTTIEETNSIELFYLFYDLRNDKGDPYPASVVPFLLRNGQRFPKSVDLSIFLTDWDTIYEKDFITHEMSAIYDQNHKMEIVELRKTLITQSERNFVENLGLIYDDPTLSVSNS